jgi:hypothetical protein
MWVHTVCDENVINCGFVMGGFRAGGLHPGAVRGRRISAEEECEVLASFTVFILSLITYYLT